MSDLFDIKQSLFQEAFATAASYQDYLKTANPGEVERWQRSYDSLTLPDSLKTISQTFTRKLHLLVLSGTWCGDCVKNCPIIAKIAEACPTIDLRFIDNQKNTALRDELRIHGAARVPLMVGLSEDFFEVGRYGERPLSMYQRKVERETGASCGVSFGNDPQEEVTADITGWFEVIERWQLLLRTSGLLRKRHND